MENKKLDKLKDQFRQTKNPNGVQPAYVLNEGQMKTLIISIKESHRPLVKASMKLVRVLKLAYGHHYPAGMTELRDLEKAIAALGYRDK